MRKALFLLAAIPGLFLISCENKMDEAPSVSVSFEYTLTANRGNYMSGTKASNADIFDAFYEKMADGTLTAPSFNLTFVEVNNGFTYNLSGNWADKKLFTLRTGTYQVTGTSTAPGDIIQEKCSLIFNETVVINEATTTVTLGAIYDCFLLVFSDASIAELKYNSANNASTPFFTFGSYFYAFIRTSNNADYLSGKHTNQTAFRVNLTNLSFDAGKYYIYNDITLAYNLPYMEEGGDTSGGTVNLSANATANCYITPKNGHYSFNATVRGNSTNSVGTISGASVVWETLNSSVQPAVGDVIKNVSFENGVISFDTTDNEGNALIAALDGNGKILWSWHIWVTDYSPSTEYDTYVGFDGVKVMNRNLGALSNLPGATSVGLIYEWGRKEPFLGNVNGSTMKATAEMEISTTSSSIGLDDYAISHPCVYIVASSQGNDWRHTSNSSAWGSTKTELDPCPAGWKVPEGGTNGIWKNFQLGTFDSTNKGMTFGSACASPDVWMPAQGYMSDSNTYSTGWWQAGVEGRYWTTTTLGDIYSEYMSFTDSNIYISHSSNEWSTHCSRANGMAIRCVEDK